MNWQLYDQIRDIYIIRLYFIIIRGSHQTTTYDQQLSRFLKNNLNYIVLQSHRNQIFIKNALFLNI